MKQTIMTGANMLTIVRIVLVPCIVVALLKGYSFSALYLFVGAALTDYLDGFVARTFNQCTKVGAWLDPIADKLLVLSLLICFYSMSMISFWFLFLFLLKDCILISGVILLYWSINTFIPRPRFLGKLSAATTMLFVAYVLYVFTVYGFQLVPLSMLTVLLIIQYAALIDYGWHCNYIK